MAAGPERATGPRRTVFWKVAGVLVGVQLATGVLAVALSGWLVREASLELVRGSLELRLDRLAEEVEGRVVWPDSSLFEGAAFALPRRLRLDLATRLPDPLYLVDDAGRLRAAFGAGADSSGFRFPDAARPALDRGQIEVAFGEGWALSPILAPDGLPAGALIVRPLDRTLDALLRAPRAAVGRAVWTVAAVAVGSALVLGALMTAALVRPLRRITRRVEALGAGDFSDRLADDRPDELGRLAAAVNDMAARVEASLESLRATDRLRRELVANVGHDLRTPLAALSAQLEEAERMAEEKRPAEAAEALAAARREAARAARLVADLFELAVLDAPSAAGALRREPVPLAELLADAAGSHRAAFRQAGIQFEAAIPPGLPTLDADGARLLRVLDNLLTNARRHTSPGGTVRLDAEAQGDRVFVRVSDSGEGIAPDDLDAVFERYYRGRSARTRTDAGGTGLGLAIARAVARAHGGDLTAASATGEGSAFTLTLPRSAKAPAGVSG